MSEQQQAVVRLLELSGAFDTAKLSEDLKSVGCSELEVSHSLGVVSQGSGEPLNPELIFNKLFPEENSDCSQKLHDWFIRVMHRAFLRVKQAKSIGREICLVLPCSL